MSQDVILQDGSADVTIDDDYDFLLNDGHSGFYRTVYDSNQIARIKIGLGKNQFSPLNRLGILSDSFEAAKAGYASTADTLELLQAYKDEDNTFVWEVMAGLLGSIRHTMRDDDLREAMKPFNRELAARQVTRLGWDAAEGESHFDTLLRPTALGLAAASDDEAVVAEALKRFKDMQKPEDVAPDVRPIVYTTAARKGAEAEFDKLLAMHNASKNSEDRLMLAGALTAFEQPELIQRALAQIDAKDVRLQDAAYWVAYSFGNRFARDMTWDWMIAHWDWLQQNMGGDLSFYRMPNYAARNYSDASFLPTFKEFFESHMSTAFERPVKQAIETIEWQSAWRTRDLDSIKEFFS
jgi:aminopeptidase N